MSNDTQKKIAILKKARHRIIRGLNVYVCVAIEDAGDDLEMKPDAKALVNEINCIFRRDGVFGGSTVSEWLHRKYGVDYTDLTYTRLREYRVAWLDSWIEDLGKSLAAGEVPG